MSEYFKVSFQKVTKLWIQKSVSVIKRLLKKDLKSRKLHHVPRSVLVIPSDSSLKKKVTF